VIANDPVEIVILLSAENAAVAALVRPSLKDVVQEDNAIVEKSKPAEGNTISIMLLARRGVVNVIEMVYVPREDVVIDPVLTNCDTVINPLVGVICQLVSVRSLE